MVRLFLSLQFHRILRYFTVRPLAKVVTLLLFGAVFLCVSSLVYFFFIAGFRYINAEVVEDIQSALGLFLYEVFFLILAVIIACSALVSSLFNLFRSRQTSLLISTPRYYLAPLVTLCTTTFSSFCISLIVFIPGAYAFIKVFEAPIIGITYIVIALLLLLITVNTLVISCVILLGTIYHYITSTIKTIPFRFSIFVGISVASVALCILYGWHTVRDVKLVSIFRADTVTDTLHTDVISNHFQFIPTHHLAKMMLSLQEQSLVSACISLLLFSLITIASLVIYRLLMRRAYIVWQRFQEHTSVRVGAKASFTTPYRFIGSPLMVIYKKELLVASRDMKSLTWLLFLVAIWLMQIGANVIIGRNVERYESDIMTKTVILQAIQYGIALYFISAFTLRFAFPSFSSEKKTSWILASSPVVRSSLVFGKYVFFTTLFTSIGIVMQYINSVVINLDMTHTLFSLLFFVISSVTIVSCGVLLGVLFPNNDTDDPESATTSMTGIFFTVTALLYSGVSSFLLYRVGLFESSAVFYACMWGVLSLGVSCMCVFLARRASARLFTR